MKVSTEVKIAGFRKTSLIDYPDNISTVLFTQGCNCRCGYCHNPGLIAKTAEKDYMDLKYFWNFLNERGHLLDGVVITGGEPTLQDNLVSFVNEIKNRDMKVKLDTNGSGYKIIRKLIEKKLVDYLAMDIKVPFKKYKNLSNDENIVSNIKKSKDLILGSEIKHEFRTTVVPEMHTKNDIEKIVKSINGADKYYIQNFRPEITLDPEFGKRRKFPESKLKKFKNIAEKYIDIVEIRN